MPYPSLPFGKNNVKYIFLKEFSEIFGSYADVNLIVYLNGDSNAVAFSDAKATRKRYLVILDMMLGKRALEKLYYFR